MVYAWAADGTVIEGQITDKLVVTADMIGKKISVTVTGDEASTATAETGVVTAAEGEDLAIVEAKQTAAKSAEITFNKEAAGLTITVSKDNKAVSQEVLAVDGTKVTLQFGSNLVAGTYTVKAVDAEKKEATGEFTAEAAILTTVEFANKNLLVSSNTTEGMKKAYAVLTSTDQWGEHMNISGATFTVSKESSHSFNADSGVLTVNAPTSAGTTTYQNANYTIGETVVVTVQYTAGQTPKVVTGVLTVSLADAVKTLTFGDLTTDNKTYQGKDTTQDALQNGDYYFPVTEATSEAGIKLDTEMLNSMIQSTENAGGTLFISPNSSTRASAYVYANGFVEKKINGVATPCLSVKTGNNINQLNIDLDYTITVVSQSGLNQTLTVPIKRNAVVKTVEITNIPAMYAGKYVELPLKATDIYENAFDLYDKIKVGTSYTNAAANGTNEVHSTSITVVIDDEKDASSTDTNFTVTSTTGVTAKVVVDTSKKTSTLMVMPDAKGYMTITGTTAGFGAINYANITVNDFREVTGIQGLKKISTTLTEHADNQTFATANVVFTGSDSEAVAAANAPLYSPVLLQTGNNLTDDSTATGDDRAKNIFPYADDKAALDGTLGGYNFNGITGGTLSATANAIQFVWSAKLMNIAKDNVTTNTYAGEAIELQKGATSAVIDTVGTSGKSNTLRVILYKIVCKTNTTWDVTEVTHKDFEFDTISESDVSYKLEINKENNIEPKLYSHKADADSIGVTLMTTTGAAVPQSKLAQGAISFTIDGKNTDAFKYSAGKIYMTKDLNAEGTAKMSAIFDTDSGKTATAEVEFGYTKEEPYAVSAEMYYADKTVYSGSTVYANATGIVNGSTSKTSNDIDFVVSDQYGNDILLDWPTDAKVAPVSVKVTKKVDTITGADYTTDGLVLYASAVNTAAAGTNTVVVTSGTVNKTFYVTATQGDTYPTKATVQLASVRATTLAETEYGTGNAAAAVLAGTDTEGNAVAANSLTVVSVEYTDPAGNISWQTPGTNAETTGVIIFLDASDTIKTVNQTKAGKYKFTLGSSAMTGTAEFTYEVASRDLVATDLCSGNGSTAIADEAAASNSTYITLLSAEKSAGSTLTYEFKAATGVTSNFAIDDNGDITTFSTPTPDAGNALSLVGNVKVTSKGNIAGTLYVPFYVNKDGDGFIYGAPAIAAATAAHASY